MGIKADLHIHTTYSDGACSPSELVHKAKHCGLSVISITDHDTVSGIDEAAAIGKDLNVEVIAGLELSATFNGQEIHILGYFMDHHNKNLLDYLERFREERIKRAERMVGKLNRLNIPISMESVLNHVTGESVGRPHIATALVDEGHAESYHQAFRKYIADGGPAYERKWNFSPEEVVRLIGEAGGLSFLAHPGHSINEDSLYRIIKAGLDGIEVIHPSHSPELVYYYRGIVNEYYLLESGGSDFHGGPKGDEDLLGQVGVPLVTVEIMRHRLFSS